MKCLVMSDSFKGTLTSKQIGLIIQEELAHLGLECDYIPVSDGGEGFVESIAYIAKSEPTAIPVFDAIGRISVGKYLYLPKTNSLFVELAECVGINKLSVNEYDIFNASTFGLGRLLNYAINKHKPKAVYIGLGGSASIDLGAGILEGLGVEFFDSNNQKLNFIGNNKLQLVKKADLRMLEKYQHINFYGIVDVQIDIFGEEGAIKKYCFQKGAKSDNLREIADNAESFFALSSSFLGESIADYLGAGSAGGASFAVNKYLNAKLISGSEFILNYIKPLLGSKNYDFVITGEGTVDSQTSQGKLVSGVVKTFPKTVILCGVQADEVDYKNLYSIVPSICSLEQSLAEPETALRQLIRTLRWKDLVKYNNFKKWSEENGENKKI